MSKAKQTAGKTAQGAATRKRKEAARALVKTLEEYATLDKIAAVLNSTAWAAHDNTPKSVYKEFRLKGRKHSVWARLVVIHIDTGATNSAEDLKRRDELRNSFERRGLDAGGADIAKLKAIAAKQTAEKAARKCGGSRLAAAWEATPTTRASFFMLDDETLKSLDAVARRRGLKSREKTLSAIISEAVKKPISVSVDECLDTVGLSLENPPVTGIIGGEGWRKFRAMGLKLRKDADALVEYFVGSEFYKPKAA